jgi:2-polyprenyl-3-methyl-5-hydroxy-6-metoxy-1,4-benzoquinol methylase
MSDFLRRPTCELCGGSDTVALCSVPYTDEHVRSFMDSFYEGKIPADLLRDASYEILKCRACGFFWQANVLSSERSNALYEDWIDPVKSLQKRESNGPAYYLHLAKFTGRVKELVTGKTNRVMDFGMGWGHWCRMANAFGLEATGCELSPARIAYAERFGVKVSRDLAALADNSFSFINADQVFEHVEQPLELLKDLVRTLVPGGYVHIAVPNGGGTETHFKQNWKAGKDAWQPLEHINSFTPKTLQKLGELAELQPVSILPTNNPVLLKLGRKIPSDAYRVLAQTNQYFQKTNAS